MVAPFGQAIDISVDPVSASSFEQHDVVYVDDWDVGSDSSTERECQPVHG